MLLGGRSDLRLSGSRRGGSSSGVVRGASLDVVAALGDEVLLPLPGHELVGILADGARAKHAREAEVLAPAARGDRWPG